MKDLSILYQIMLISEVIIRGEEGTLSSKCNDVFKSHFYCHYESLKISSTGRDVIIGFIKIL